MGRSRCTVGYINIRLHMKESFQIITIGYVYQLPDIWPKYEAAISLIGWRKAVILTQIAQVFAKANAEYYNQCAEMDAVARGFTQHQGKHFDLLVSDDDLPDYTDGIKPIFPPSPLAAIPDPKKNTPRYSFGQFRCSSRTAAVLKMALIVDQPNINMLMTKMFSWYYPRFWNLYLPQFAAVEQRRILPDMENFELEL